MLQIDLLIAIVIMSLLFLRHINVYKDRNKINYTPIVIGIGMIMGLLHFVMMADSEGWLLALRESLLTVIVGVILSAIMSVMSQTQQASNHHEDNMRIQNMDDEVRELKALFSSLHGQMGQVTQMEDSTQVQLKSLFKEEIDALNIIQNNQKLFIQKIESILTKQQVAMEKFEEFTLNELPSLDNVVHRHIDLLRISEQDHFNQLKNAAKISSEDKKEVNEELMQIKSLLQKLQKSQSMESVIMHLEEEFSRIIHDFSRNIQTIGAKSESIVTTLLENEKILIGSREQSELIMQQMVLSSNHMREMSQNSKELNESIKPLGHLFSAAELLHKEFIMAKSKLTELIVTLEGYEKQEHREMREHLENVANEAIAQMQLFTQMLSQQDQPHQHVSPKEVLDLTHKVKLHQSYTSE
ncbi:MAG: hypothetical protein Q8N01_08275 [Sulfuricurvum sp.]|nr:hypothetical protein [Sulfuricurvum sp.]MDP3022030.1 hypothetical protein [Sulfuricurvum sp.]MDP3120396.1 hypothetical protein [Sulfuricurvum sp.]